NIHDDYSPYAWSPHPMPYGPVSILPFYLAGLVSTFHPFAAVYTLKALWYLIHVVTLRLLTKLLNGREHEARSLFLFAFNPLLVLELLINGHNDGLVVCSIVAALLAIRRRQLGLGVVLAAVPALAKLPCAVLFAAVAVYLIRQRGFVMVAYAAAVLVVAAVLMRISFFSSIQSTSVLLGVEPVWNNPCSFYGIVFRMLGHSPGWRAVWGAVAATVMAAFAVWRLAQVRHFQDIVRETIYVFLAMFCGYAVFEWYLSWLVPLAAIAATARIQETVVLYTLTSLVC